MENASRAFILAGEILIGVLVLSLASYIVIQFGTFSRTLNEKMDERQITEFNVNFTNCSGRANISMQEIASIINLANQRNSEYDVMADYYVDVLLDGRSVLNTNINELLENNKNTTYYYCNLTNLKILKRNNNIEVSANATESDISYNSRTQLVNVINFHTVTGIYAQEYANALLEGNQIVWNIP